MQTRSRPASPSLPASSCLVALLAALLWGCLQPATSGRAEAPPEELREVLGPSDVVEIKVYRSELLSQNYRLDGDGLIDFPLVGAIEAAGRTPTELAALLRDGLADGYLVDPQVSVLVREYNSRKVSVIGEVQQPGRYPYRQGMTLVEAIADAGGTTPTAALGTVRITRLHGDRAGGEREDGFDVPFRSITRGRAPDVALVPGDIVFVAESPVR